MNRIILHSDANSFYASVECCRHPELKEKPVAVCGDPEARHGIVLTANRVAKAFGVRTGTAIWQARQVCPELIALRPDYSEYLRFSQALRRIYLSYTDRVEPFGLDECWLDVSQPGWGFAEGVRIAESIRARVREELGITVSVGVSYNKVFAKLASDMKKPDATTVLTQKNYRERVWPLPASDLLYVGPRTSKKLLEFGISTIGDLANADESALTDKLGKNGFILRAFANGFDTSSVLCAETSVAVKSVGNSTTPPHDIETSEDVRCLTYLLSESVAARLREHGFRCRRVAISIRRTDLSCFSCQTMLPQETNLADDVAQAALELFAANFPDRLPLRSMGVSCSALQPDDLPVQFDLLGETTRRLRREQLDRTCDRLRQRYGHQIVQRGVVLADHDFSSTNPREENTLCPFSLMHFS